MTGSIYAVGLYGEDEKEISSVRRYFKTFATGMFRAGIIVVITGAR